MKRKKEEKKLFVLRTFCESFESTLKEKNNKKDKIKGKGMNIIMRNEEQKKVFHRDDETETKDVRRREKGVVFVVILSVRVSTQNEKFFLTEKKKCFFILFC